MNLDQFVETTQAYNTHSLHITNGKNGIVVAIAINNIKFGPAIGGCRLMSYTSQSESLIDVLKLASAMTLKASIHRLPHGGAKAVIFNPNNASKNSCKVDSSGFCPSSERQNC